MVECGTCGAEFALVPVVMPVLKLTEDQPPTQPLKIKRSNPCLTVNGKIIDYCSDECFKKRNEVADCWACGMPNPSEFHVGRERINPEGLRCPGCCGPVYANNFCAEEEASRFTAYTCGESIFKTGKHGSLAYIRPGDTRELQQALDEEFAKKQAARKDWKDRFLAGEELYEERSCWGPVTRTRVTHCPRGALEATTHNVDCKCVRA